MSTFTPPPTYANPVITDPVTKEASFNPIWLKWFIDVAAYITLNGGGSSTGIHNNLQGLQGGATNEYYHLTAIEFNTLTAGFDGSGFVVLQTGPTIANLKTSTDPFISSTVTLANHAGSGAGTLSNAPVAGNPAKWIAFNDNGTTRYIPCW